MGKSYCSRKIGLEVLLCLYCCVGRHRHLHYFLSPETKSRALEEIAEVFDGSNTAVHIDSKLEHGASTKTERSPTAVISTTASCQRIVTRSVDFAFRNPTRCEYASNKQAKQNHRSLEGSTCSQLQNSHTWQYVELIMKKWLYEYE
jgi:hypothetical protein